MLETRVNDQFVKNVTVEYEDGTKEEIIDGFIVVNNDSYKWLVRFCLGVDKDQVVDFANDFLDGDVSQPIIERKKNKPNHLTLIKG